MGRVVMAFSMSLDGFVAGPGVSVEQPMGEGGERLHEWLFNESPDRGVDPEMARELSDSVGAVVLGRRTFEVGLGPWEDTPYPVPCFVLAHERHENLAMPSGTFTFVNDGIEIALGKAQAVAGERDVILMGADTAQQYLRAGLVDEIYIQLVPLVLGSGTRLFENLGTEPIELEMTRAVKSPFVTHMRFRVLRNRPASLLHWPGE
ncbi:dihydrofolate reductase family protein [Pseudaminobacter soli (ex Li et al. 2025)]|uniref:Deaminase n=1 Tax=Pseudaminobacter soli (ex Li et al. 2025) TaxID=1295366 RepID=A0A2P7SN53_9HYPH|nr:dihydrofolate reductase family protein [Mesorhizobium soli]PSJ63924.1 deaminase [Mesorhizobium soli]